MRRMPGLKAQDLTQTVYVAFAHWTDSFRILQAYDANLVVTPSHLAIILKVDGAGASSTVHDSLS